MMQVPSEGESMHPPHRPDLASRRASHPGADRQEFTTPPRAPAFRIRGGQACVGPHPAISGRSNLRTDFSVPGIREVMRQDLLGLRLQRLAAVPSHREAGGSTM
jgi:hypothetical protein